MAGGLVASTQLRSRTGRAMGTTVDIRAMGAPTSAFEWAVERLGQLEAAWSRFDRASELSLLNAAAGSGAVVVSADLLDVVDAALRLWRATDGYFDPTTHDALVALGYDETFERVRERASCGGAHRHANGAGRVPGATGVIVDHEQSTVLLPDGVHLDLGGVGKGRAADLLAAGMVERGAEGACVSVGGDIAVSGAAPEGGWPVHVADALEPELDRWVLPVYRGAVVQSSCRVRSWGVGDQRRHHIVDPRTGMSAASGITAVVVLADEAWWAEGVAKAAIVAGAVEGAALLRRLARAGWLVRDDGAVIPVGALRVSRAA